MFGSVTRDDFTMDSDVDVLVEFEPGNAPGWEFVDLAEELSEMLSRRVDLNIPNSLSRYFRDEVLAEAEVLYDAASPEGYASLRTATRLIAQDLMWMSRSR